MANNGFQLGLQNILGGLRGLERKSEKEATARQRAFAKQEERDLQEQQGFDKQTEQFNRDLRAREFKTSEREASQRFKSGLSKKTAEKARLGEERKMAEGQKKIRRSLTGKRDKIVKEFSPIDRVFGNVDAFQQKIDRGEALTASDQFQLVRSIVPLAEINPGVVRGEEFETARSLGGKLGAAQVAFNNLAKGELLPPSVIRDMLETTQTMRGVISRGKESRFSDLLEESKFEGLGEEDQEVILGGTGKSVLQGLRDRENADLIAAQEQQQAEQALMSLTQAPQQLQQVPFAPQQQQFAPVPQAQAQAVDPTRQAKQSRIQQLRQKRGF